jgi:hypothetical protein
MVIFAIGILIMIAIKGRGDISAGLASVIEYASELIGGFMKGG